MELKSKALSWRHRLSLEHQLYLAIEANHLLKGDTVDNHPNNLEREDIETIYNYNFDYTSIVRSNMLENKDYKPYCMNCTGLQRLSITTKEGQHKCPICSETTKYSKEFIKVFNITHNL